MTYRTRRRVRRLIRAIVIALVLALALCEVGLRVAVALATPGPSQDLNVKRRSGTMPQYAHSPYWSPQFVDSLATILRDYGTLDENGMPAFRDANVLGYTIKDYLRVTTDQPDHFNRTVWLYGSSTVWAAFNDDEHTIPSYLQREFNRRGIRWRVMNAGQPDIEIAGEYYWLQQTPLRSGDMVIFIDGTPELDNTLADARKDWRGSKLACQLAERVPLLTLSLFCDAQVQGETPEPFIQEQAAAHMKRYWHFSDLAAKYAQAHGVEYVHMIQPLAFACADLYQRMARGDVILTVDAADYFDSWHYSDAGNERIAAQIAGVVTAF